MQKIIEIEEGRSMNFKASAFSPIAYNRLFPGRDFLKDIGSLEEVSTGDDESLPMEVYEQFVRVAYTFAYQGLAPTPRETEEQRNFREKYPDPWEWIDSFGAFSIYEILPQVIELWYTNEKMASQGKNGVPAPPGK